jgi:hypothetical protein
MSRPRPTLVDGVLYVGAADGSLHAVDAERGSRVWRFQGEGKVRGSVAVRDDAVVFGTLANRIHQLDRQSGREVMRWDTTGPVTGTPAWSGEHFIVGDRGSQLAARRPGRAEPAWSQPYWGSWIESSAVVHGGTGYVGSGDLFLVSAFDPASGRNLWRAHVGGWVLQRPAVSAERVFRVGVRSASSGGTLPRAGRRPDRARSAGRTDRLALAGAVVARRIPVRRHAAPALADRHVLCAARSTAASTPSSATTFAEARGRSRAPCGSRQATSGTSERSFASRRIVGRVAAPRLQA